MRSYQEEIPFAIDQQSNEYVQYAQDVEQTLSKLEAGLHHTDDPQAIIMDTLVAVTAFYDGDWAGIMEADLVMKVWSTLWWYNRNTNGMTPNRFGDIEDGEYLSRWIEALTSGKPMIIENIEDIKGISPIEYFFLKHNGVQSMIAVPFWKRPTGFLIVRNPKRYATRTSLLQMLAFVAVSSVNEKRLMDSARMSSTPEAIKQDTDIVVNLFGCLKIHTSKGLLTMDDISSPKIVRMLTYLLIHTERACPSREIVSAIWPDEDPENAGRIIKNLVYRFQQVFGLISDYRMIESTTRGYRINPELHLITDLGIFSQYCKEALTSSSQDARKILFRKALDIYQDGIMPMLESELWLMPTVFNYRLQYIGILNEFLTTLESVKDYVSIHEYATEAVRIVPGNPDGYYWLVLAMNKLGTYEIAKNLLRVAQQMLIDEDYQDLLRRLKIQDFE